MKREEREAKTDCFAYRKKGEAEACSALNALYCKHEDCKFYKKRKAKENE